MGHHRAVSHHAAGDVWLNVLEEFGRTSSPRCAAASTGNRWKSPAFWQWNAWWKSLILNLWRFNRKTHAGSSPRKIPVLTWVQTWVLHDFMWFHGQILPKDSKEKSQDRNKISGFYGCLKGPFSVDPWGPPTFGESQVPTAPAETAGANGSRGRQLRCLPSTWLLGVARMGTWRAYSCMIWYNRQILTTAKKHVDWRDAEDWWLLGNTEHVDRIR